VNALVTAAATRVVAVAVALLGADALGAGGLAGPAQPLCADAAAAHHATVVVSHLDHGYASPVRVCVGFTEESITGHQLLDRSGIQFGLNANPGLGSEVCQVDHEPATYDPNNCLRAGQPYWSVWQAPYRGAWTYTRYGIDGVTIRDGDAEGFRFGQNPGAPDPPGTICPPPSPASPPPSTAATSPGAAPPGPAAAPTNARSRPTANSDGAAAAPPPGASPDASPGASPDDPGQMAVLESPVARGPSDRPPPALSAAPPPDRLGLVVAGVGAVSLLLLLAAQLLFPRLRP
jgi:hypothetical protein